MRQILTSEQIIESFRKVHGNTYDYSKVVYIKSNEKIEIICPEHGSFFQTPNNHKNGQRCPKCSGKLKHTKEEIIEKMNLVHNNIIKKYEYNIPTYNNIFQKIKIKCLVQDHGIFEQTISNHINGKGCPKCGKISSGLKNTSNQEDVIEQFKKVHHNKYDYSEVEYKKTSEKVKIICPEHGPFLQTPNAHKMGSGCPSCGGKQKLTIPQIINRAQNIHSIDSKPKYHYNIEKYNSVNDIIDIICPEHGIFSQTVISHLSGNGCPKCGKESISKLKRLPQNEIIEQFKMVHSNKYDYSQVQYLNSMEKVQIICPDHGSFFQKPNDHKNGQGCPSCKINKAQDFFINLFKEYNIKSIRNDRNLIKPLEIDILVPDFNFGIEHNGLLYHSSGISNWNATNNYSVLDKNRHLNKTIKMVEQEYQLFHIREDHFLNPIKKEIWKSILLNKCKISTKTHARKHVVVDLNPYQDFIKQFLEENHLQGNCVSSIKLGLQDPKTGIVYSIMTFGKSRFDKNIEYELLRFCNLRYHNVRGAASKLMSTFEKTIKPTSIVSYANRDWSQGNLYKSLGFEFIKSTSPNYVYVNNTKIIKRQHVQKHKLKNFFKKENKPFWPELSERDNMINNGYRILYDTGNLVYHKNY